MNQSNQFSSVREHITKRNELRVKVNEFPESVRTLLDTVKNQSELWVTCVRLVQDFLAEGYTEIDILPVLQRKIQDSTRIERRITVGRIALAEALHTFEVSRARVSSSDVIDLDDYEFQQSMYGIF